MEGKLNQALYLLGGLAVGMGLMYMLDPDRGRTRRALARDKAGSLVLHTSTSATHEARNIRNHAKGLVHDATKLFSRSSAISDIDLSNQIRAQMLNVVPHPESLHVTVHHRRVTLSGPILSNQVQKVIEQVAMIPGVAGVNNRLTVYQSPEDMPSTGGVQTQPQNA